MTEERKNPSITEITAWSAKASVLRERGKNQSLHDINQAADYLESAVLFAQSHISKDHWEKSHLQYVKLDGPELWEILFGVNSDAATDIKDDQYDQIAKTINDVFIEPIRTQA